MYPISLYSCNILQSSHSRRWGLKGPCFVKAEESAQALVKDGKETRRTEAMKDKELDHD